MVVFPRATYNSTGKMLLTAAVFLLFETCIVASNPMKSSNENSIRESKVDVEWQDDFLIREERGRRRRRRRECKKGETNITYISLDESEAPDSHCRKCPCIRGKFRRCRVYVCELGQLQCDREDYEFLPGQCCPVCKSKSCSENREVGDEWQSLKKPGVCSLCKCITGRKELCQDNNLSCFDIPGCLETEMKPDHCCPQCKTWSEPTTQPPIIIIQLTTEHPEPSFPFPNNWRDTAEDQDEN